MKKGDGRVSYRVHPSPMLGDGRMDALKDGRDGRGMDARWTGEWTVRCPNDPRIAHWMKDSAQVTAPGAVTSMIAAVSNRPDPNRQNRST
jgi:hypothetical protein